MLKTILFCSAAISVIASTAFASDLPTHKGPPPAPTVAPPAFSWTGFYLGVNAGYADPTADLSVAPGSGWNAPDPDWGSSSTGPGIASIGQHSLGLHGFIGGGQAGYNYQIGNFVLGVEGDADYVDARDSYSTPTYGSVPVNGTSNGSYWAQGSAKVDDMFTLRLRAGVAFDRLLVFATGGVAFVDEKFSQSIGFTNSPPRQIITLPVTNGATGYNAGSASTTAVTGVVGGGLEYAFDNHWSLKGEYLYAPLKSQSFTSTYVDPSSNKWTITHHESLSALNVFRAGLNYRF